MLQGKKIILGITGSIAAYKAAYLTRALIKKGAEVQIVITPAGKEFITPVTLSALTGKPVISEFFSANDGTWHSHVDLGLWADLLLIAPATASTIGKMANGIADNMLVTTYLSAKEPVWIAPAMDLDMMRHPSTVANIERLRSFGNHIIEPGSGALASGLSGKGRMAEPEEIVATLESHFATAGSMTGKTVTITAGPTREKLDPVRFISNFSSGKMGYALAEEAARRGARVILVSGPVALEARNPLIEVRRVESAEEMLAEARKAFAGSDIAIMCAAVADYRPAAVSPSKLKRGDSPAMTLELVRNPDIAATLGSEKRPGQTLVGFALETDDAIAHGADKLRRKNLDMIVVNSLADKGAGFGTDTNLVTIITADGRRTAGTLKPKSAVAADIIDSIETLRNA